MDLPLLFEKILTSFGLIFLLAIVLVWGGYFIIKPRSVQVIVPKETDPYLWFLSPEGDQIIYTSMSSSVGGPRLLSLVNNQEFLVDNCYWFQWLDNVTLVCFEYGKKEWSLVDITDWQSTEQTSRKHLDKISVEQFLSDKGLNHTQKIYRLLTVGADNSLLITETSGSHSTTTAYIVAEIQDIDKLLQGVSYTLLYFYNTEQVTSQPVYSPNGEYYYLLERNKLAIYSRSGKLCSQFDLGDMGDHIQSFEIGGWAKDSSGVYFKFPTRAGLASGWYNKEPIRKLLVVPK